MQYALCGIRFSITDFNFFFFLIEIEYIKLLIKLEFCLCSVFDYIV